MSDSGDRFVEQHEHNDDLPIMDCFCDECQQARYDMIDECAYSENAIPLRRVDDGSIYAFYCPKHQVVWKCFQNACSQCKEENP